MRLPFLRPKPPLAGKTARLQAGLGGDGAASVEAARTRARRRLVGALVLLIAGVLGFPVLFETQPRPLPLETPIDTARRDAAAALPPPPAATKPASRNAAPPVLPVEVESESAPAAASATLPAAPPTQLPAAAPQVQPTPPVAAAAATTASPASPASTTGTIGPNSTIGPTGPTGTSDGARARALLEGGTGPASAPPTGRFIVQVGAFSDATALHDARARVEKLGLKTYTQVIDSDAGKRTRVRVGPFATRAEADAAAGKLKRGGMAANILVL